MVAVLTKNFASFPPIRKEIRLLVEGPHNRGVVKDIDSHSMGKANGWKDGGGEGGRDRSIRKSNQSKRYHFCGDWKKQRSIKTGINRDEMYNFNPNVTG